MSKEGNYNSAAKALLGVLADMTQAGLAQSDTMVVAKVASVNADQTLNLYIFPDMENIIHNIYNQTIYSFAPGDIAIVFKMKNNLSNSFVIAKCAPKEGDLRWGSGGIAGTEGAINLAKASKTKLGSVKAIDKTADMNSQVGIDKDGFLYAKTGDSDGKVKQDKSNDNVALPLLLAGKENPNGERLAAKYAESVQYNGRSLKVPNVNIDRDLYVQNSGLSFQDMFSRNNIYAESLLGTNGNMVANGNVSAKYYFGDGRFLENVTAEIGEIEDLECQTAHVAAYLTVGSNVGSNAINMYADGTCELGDLKIGKEIQGGSIFYNAVIRRNGRIDAKNIHTIDLYANGNVEINSTGSIRTNSIASSSIYGDTLDLYGGGNPTIKLNGPTGTISTKLIGATQSINCNGTIISGGGYQELGYWEGASHIRTILLDGPSGNIYANNISANTISANEFSLEYLSTNNIDLNGYIRANSPTSSISVANSVYSGATMYANGSAMFRVETGAGHEPLAIEINPNNNMIAVGGTIVHGEYLQLGQWTGGSYANNIMMYGGNGRIHANSVVVKNGFQSNTVQANGQIMGGSLYTAGSLTVGEGAGYFYQNGAINATTILARTSVGTSGSRVPVVYAVSVEATNFYGNGAGLSGIVTTDTRFFNLQFDFVENDSNVITSATASNETVWRNACETSTPGGSSIGDVIINIKSPHLSGGRIVCGTIIEHSYSTIIFMVKYGPAASYPCNWQEYSMTYTKGSSTLTVRKKS